MYIWPNDCVRPKFIFRSVIQNSVKICIPYCCHVCSTIACFQRACRLQFYVHVVIIFCSFCQLFYSSLLHTMYWLETGLYSPVGQIIWKIYMSTYRFFCPECGISSWKLNFTIMSVFRSKRICCVPVYDHDLSY